MNYFVICDITIKYSQMNRYSDKKKGGFDRIMKKFWKIAVLVTAMGMTSATSYLLSQQGATSNLAELGLADFVQSEITYDGVMHELYWHYEFANQMIRVARYDDAKAHLKIIAFYVNLLPYLTREQKFFRAPAAVKKFDQYAQDLITLSNELITKLGNGDPVGLGKEMEKRVSYLCYHCHKDLKTPVRDITPYGKKIEMGPARRKKP